MTISESNGDQGHGGDRCEQLRVRWSAVAQLWRDSSEQWSSVEEKRAAGESQTREKKRVWGGERKNSKINARDTVTVHICMVTVALVHLCTILQPLIWVFFFFFLFFCFFLSKCVIWSVFCILKDFVSTDADALRACKACYYYYLLSASFWLFNLIMRN